MTCIRNKFHNKTDTVCQDCLKTINAFPSEPPLMQLDAELRALFTQLTLQNRDLYVCWKSSYKKLKIFDKLLKIENIYYAFYKADIGNLTLKRICGTPGCVNPAHHRSRFEEPHIKKKVQSGFNRKLKNIDELTMSEWLKHS